jgi:hypothetical protein
MLSCVSGHTFDMNYCNPIQVPCKCRITTPFSVFITEITVYVVVRVNIIYNYTGHLNKNTSFEVDSLLEMEL